AADEEEQLVDQAVVADIGDVLHVLRRRVPTGRTGPGHDRNGACDRARHVVVVNPTSAAADEGEQFVDALVGPDIGDVLDVFRGGVPAGRTGAGRDRNGAGGSGAG